MITGALLGYLLCTYKNEKRVQKEIEDLQQALEEYDEIVNVGEVAKLFAATTPQYDIDTVFSRAKKFCVKMEELHDKIITHPIGRTTDSEPHP